MVTETLETNLVKFESQYYTILQFAFNRIILKSCLQGSEHFVAATTYLACI